MMHVNDEARSRPCGRCGEGYERHWNGRDWVSACKSFDPRAESALTDAGMGSLRGFLEDAGTHRGRFITITTEDAREIGKRLGELESKLAAKDKVIVETLNTFMREVPKPLLDALMAWRALPTDDQDLQVGRLRVGGYHAKAEDIAVAVLQGARAVKL